MIQKPIFILFVFFILVLKGKLRRNEARGRQFNPYVLTEQIFLNFSATDSTCCQKAVCTSY